MKQLKKWTEGVFLGLFAVMGCGFSSQHRDEVLSQVTSRYCGIWEAIGFRCALSGGGVTEDVDTVGFFFVKEGPLPDADQQQAVLVEMMEDFTSQINGCNPLRPYLSNYPFVAHNCVINVIFKDPAGTSTRRINGMLGKVSYINDAGESMWELYDEVKERVYQAKKSRCKAVLSSRL